MDFSTFFGWHNDQKAVDAVLATAKIPYISGAIQAICGSGKGKVQLLYKFVESLMPDLRYPVRTQAIGDCVAFGTAGAVDCLMATEILLAEEHESFMGITATEPIYGGSRIAIGRGQLGRGDGSIGAWAAEYVSKYGTLLKKKYGGTDLAAYNGQRAREWGLYGTPKDLEVISREHTVKTYSLVSNYDQLVDAIYNGYPVTVCSGQGFTSQRDAQGFARPSGSWPHCMLIAGIDDEYKRPGCLIINSWGPNWISGPKRHDQPDGSFWCDADVINRMLSENDSWALSSFDGYPPQDLDWNVFKRAQDKLKDYH